ncbi:amino acid adenylation domain-containing protein [Xenorhabdus griffiniae]|uniref:amino acid adenylation domain-containing protein n=1 Tax=Xenorhabdus griffiniae TaxID=351672 RepID=UPI0030CB8DC5
MSNKELSLFELRQAVLQKKIKERIENRQIEEKKQIREKRHIIPRNADQQTLPLSWAQQRLWLLAQLDPAAQAAYHIPGGLRLQGYLNLDALQAALNRIVARHEILRTTIKMVEGQALQVIGKPDSGFSLAVEELSHLPAEEQQITLEEITQRETSQPFDFAQGPLIRGRLLRLAANEHILLLTQHHIISDGWSLNILMHELSTLYHAFSEGQGDPLPALTLQYADYALWQREWLQGELLEKQVNFWRDALQGAPALLELPTDRPRPEQQSYAGGYVDITLSPELSSGLRSLSQRHGTTLFMTLMAGWITLLSRLSGQKDLVVGTPVANRQYSELEPLIGFFVNTLALRIQIDDNPTVSALLARVKAHALNAYAHQDLPFEQLVEVLKPPRSLSHSPIFQVMMSVDNTPGQQNIALPDITISEINLAENSSHFDLSLSINDTENGLVGGLEYSSDLFDHASVERIASYLQTLLTAMVKDDSQPVESLPLLQSYQRTQVLDDFNDTAFPYPQTLLIHQLFEQQVEQTPDATALVFGDSQLSYAELNRHANQLAHHLIASGVRPDDRVAICADRSLDLIIGLYAILKAGAGYIPLDPEYPAERLAYQLSDSKPVLLLTQQHLQTHLPIQETPVWLLDDQYNRDNVAKQPAHNPDTDQLGLKPHHLAYIIYTSGSTGQPKGVMLEHRNVVNFIHAQHQTSEPQLGDRILQFATIAFDTSVSDIFPTLASGATLVLRPPHIRIPDMTFVTFLREQKITIMDMPTAFWHLWVQEMMAGRSGFSPHLHTLIVGGEKAEYRHLISWLSHQETQSCRWINSYGPTETTVIATTLKLDHQNLPQLKGVIPIGYPLPNTRIYILDTHGQPVPIGVSGEIHIAGAGVARGYLNRPDLTAEKFVADPFSTQPDARMYKTGDLGRWLPDGAIEYLGRNDFQVKLRGFRIELGEIETQLVACAGVSDAVVIAREEESGDKRLIAYVIPETGMTLSPAELRKQLSSRLMEHMLPSAFVMLDAFPMSANGKLDRKALPAPDQSAIVSREYEVPQGETEQTLAAIWQSLLNVEQIGRQDNFFELGGHSLLVVNLIEQLRLHGLSLDVNAVFSAPTLAAMSTLIRHHDTQSTPLQDVPPNLIREDSTIITPDMLPLLELTQDQIDQIVSHVTGGISNVQDIYPLGPLQEGILFHHLLETEGDLYLDNHLMIFDSRTRLESFLQALQQVIDRHDILRSAVYWKELLKPVQIVYRHAPLPIIELTLSTEEPPETQLRRLTDPRAIRMDITKAPLLAAHIANDPASGKWLLSLLYHHLVCDHISLDMIFSEIQTLLLGESENLPTPLPYRNFIAQIRNVPLEVHQNYFRELLGDVEEPTLPFGLLDVQGGGLNEIVENVLTLDSKLAQNLRDCARQLGMSAAVLFHVAWAQVLARCSGRNDVVFGTVLLGRLQGGIGASEVLGMFINTLPIRVKLQARTVKQTVQETYQQLTALLDHEQAPLAVAQRCSGIQAPLPLFNSLLNFRHSPREDEHVAAMAWEGIDEIEGEERSNYPLSLDIDDFDDGFALTAQCSQQINPVRITAYMKTALEGIVAALQYAPEQAIESIDILSRAERTQLLETFNDTVVEYPQDALIHQLFEQQAARTPDAIALVFGESELSYAALNRQANQLAHQLIAAGVCPDDRIAICVDRSLDLIIGLYAILKAGAGYVPLDPEYPTERLAYQLSDSKPVLLLTQRPLQGLLPISDMPVWLLDDESQRNNVAKQPIHNPDIQLQSHHLAYIIYTSGSTGQPKGVMLEHRNVVNFIHAQHQTSEPQSGDRILQFATIAFDTSVSDIFPTLAAGATLVLRPPHIRIPDMTFVTFLREQKITIIDMPTAFWHLWVQEMMAGRSGFSPSLHTLIVGGEKAEYRHLISWLSQQETQSCRWINSYGPTETTVIATTLKLDHQNPPYPEGVIPIGYPLPNTRIYILDTHGRPVPLGVSGEIHIGGAGVARGYLNRPDLTAEKFVADPFSIQPDARMYKTGDLGRWLPDGAIEYLGRNDFQIKIRGFRIELGEIETQLLAYEDVSDAVVIAREEENGDKRLIAYVIPKAGSTLKPAELREHLSARLLEYMLPRAFVILDAFPMSANGKLDRKALPAPDQSAIVSREYEAPQGETEQKLAAVWQSLLELEQVGRHDNFFELGGHSLLVVSLIEQLRQQGLSLAVSAVFAAPTLAAMSARLHQKQDAALAVIPPNLIREDSPQITPAMLPLVTLTQAQIDRIVDHVPGGVANIQDIYPLGPLQEGILFHHLLTETGDTYLENILMHFDNRPRLTRFLQALQQVIDRHDIQRSAFHWQELPIPVQVVYRHAPLPITELTLSAGERAETQLRRLTDPDNIRLDITQAPLLAAYIARDPDTDQWWLSLLHHHLVCDHLSLEIIFSEVQTLILGEAAHLPAPLPYRNFIAQTRQVPIEVHQAYFQQLLGDVEEPTLPFGLLDVQGNSRDKHDKIVEDIVTLDEELAQQIRDCARQLGISAAVLFHVAWAQVLAQCSGREDVVFGTVLLGRLQGGMGASQVLGMFINTLPVRIPLQARTVKQAVQETYQRLSELLDHEQTPLAIAQRCSGVPASLPLFNSLLNFRHSPRDEEAAHSLAWDGIQVLDSEERSNYPLSLDVDDFDDGFALTAQCSQQINPVRITAYMKTALEGIVAALQYAPEQPIHAIDILPRAERTQLLEGFNDTAIDSPQDALIHQLFEQQAARTPDAIALVFGENELSYAALNRQANQLAHQLIAAGVCPDDRVAICVDRSLDLIIGLYAILKAGAGYVPLDPEYPAERLAYQLSDSKPVLLLTQRPLQGLLPISDIPVWLLDDESQRNSVAKQPIHNPDIQLQPHHLAYIIYTSGSTGQPKGVMLEHRNVVNFIHAQHQTSEPQSGDRILQFATIAFDTSVSDIFPTLAAGATLVLRPPHIRIPDMTFVTFLREQKITIIDMPTAFWHLWVQEMMAGRSGFSPHLHTLIVGGEKAEYRHLISWLSHQETQSCRWINSYGPTETTVIATTLKVDGTSTLSTDITDNIPIGYPLPNTRIYILDTHGRPVPLGVSGEIHIGGAGVARGYLNRPDLTAEKFVADPFSTQPDARMYKTGDLGRWLPDGAIEYLGRNDFQIKIRGFRIELGEIETQLLAYEDVHDAVVIAREEESGDKRLIAYVIPKAGITLKPADLHEYLSARLLEYMLPRAFVILDAFPMSANGKLDRKALPAPDQSAIVSREYEAPQGETEQKLAAVWQSLLELEQVGRHDNFFELGGHSLLVVSLIEQLRQQGLSLAVSAVFAAPTLAAMSDRLHQKQDAALAVIPPNLIREDSPQITPAMLPLVTLTQPQIDRIVDHVPGGVANIQDIYPLGPLQEGILFHHLLTETGDTYLENILMHFDNRPRLTRFLQALQQVIDRHDIQRSAFHWQELPIPVQVVYRHAPLPITELTLSAGERAETQLRRLTDPDSIRLDITQAPLLAAYIARDPDTDQWWLSLLHHHLVCDHLSLEIIFSEVQALILGEAAHLPAPLPYRNFIAQTRQVPIEVHQAYFQQLLGDVEEPTLPFGLLDVQGNSRDKHDKIVEDIVTLDEELAQQIRNCARQLGISAAVLFHVAWAQVLAQCSGREDVVFGTVLLGRLQGGMGASQVLGMFINTLPVRIPLQARTVKQAVQETYQRLSELLDHEQTPLAIAQRCSGVPASLPLFNSLLNFRHSPRDEEATHSLAWDGIQVLDSEERSNYPLSLDVDDFDDGFALTAQCSQQINPVRITAYMKTALEGIVAALQYAPEQPIHAIDILPRAERTQLLETFNDTVVEYPQDALIHQLFEQQAARTPDAIALVFGESELSYAALNRQANQLAHQLIAAGVRPDDRIAICVDRSLDLIIGLYAILKAGAGYVPLDPEYPAERLAYQLSDSKPVLLLTQRSLQGLLPISDMPVWLLDDDSQRNNVAKQPIHNPDIQLQSHHLAYIIYTSGSTGQPKGVMLEHRNVVNFIHAQHQTSEPQSGDRILQFATIAFDTSVSDIFPTLASGATLVLRPAHIRVPDAEFVNLLNKQKITIMDMPTAFWHQWVQEMMAGRSGFGQYLRTVIVGGEKAELRHLISWQSIPETQSCRWINSYGPTETTVIATTLKVDGTSTLSTDITDNIPIGYPLPNTRIYILDTFGKPVPLGVSGEIHIGGAGVARGYLNRPDLTAEKFVADPFSKQPDARMYKTGDLGRWLPDGAIEYLGRNDFQVKLRGFRIELGEIETRLVQCQGVQDAIVLIREITSDDKRLVAYVQPESGVNLVPSELRQQLAQQLAEFTLPSAFVILDAFPLTSNGKIDRQAFPAPDQSAIVTRDYEAPQGEVEITLAQIWQDLLGVERVSRHDHFFELGGHSLLILKASSLAIEKLGLQQNMMASLMTFTTIKEQARAIEDRDNIHVGSMVGLSQNLKATPLFFAPGAGGHVLYLRELATALEGIYAVWGMQSPELDGRSDPPSYLEMNGLEAMASVMIDDLKKVQPNGPYYLAGHSFGGWLVFEMARQLVQQGESIGLLALVDSESPLESLTQRNESEWSNRRWLAEFGNVLAALAGAEENFTEEEFESMTEEEQLDNLRLRLIEEELLPPQLEAKEISAYLNVFKAHSLATYQPQERYSGTLHLFLANEEYEGQNISADSIINGWKTLVTGEVISETLSGDHITIMRQPFVQGLASAIASVNIIP